MTLEMNNLTCLAGISTVHISAGAGASLVVQCSTVIAQPTFAI